MKTPLIMINRAFVEKVVLKKKKICPLGLKKSYCSKT